MSTVIDDPGALLLAYSRDQCVLAESGAPAAAVLAASIEDVITTVRLAADFGIPVVTRGAGTGLAGGANALDGCVVLVLSRMKEILDLDPISRTARVQPGVINGDLDRAARGHGLWYPPDPGSRDISSIGGNLATNAGGMCCAKYGVTADHVLQLAAVLGTGELVTVGTVTRKDVAGLDLKRLLVGSEGTLGVIVEATMRLLPVVGGIATVAATFPTAADAISTVLAIGDLVKIAAAELMDRTTVRAVNSLTRMGLDEDAGALLLLRLDGPDAARDAALCAELAQQHGAEVFHAADEQEGIALMAARRAAYPALEAQGVTLLDDVGVAVHRLPELLAQIERIGVEQHVTIGTFGHAADGNLHPTVVFNASDPREAARARAAFDQIVGAALDLGGTISGEHGIGVLKQPYVGRQVGAAEQALMRRVKTAFDPHGVLNPGRSY